MPARVGGDDEVPGEEVARRIRVLCVGPDDETADRLAVSLEADSDRLSTARATSGLAALETFGEERVDCVVSTAALPGMDGPTLRERVRALDPDLPFLVVDDEEAGEAAGGSGDGPATPLAARVEAAVDRRRTLDRAVQEAALADRVLDTVPVGVLVRDGDGTVTWANDRAEQLLPGDGASVTPLEEWASNDEAGDPLAPEDRPFERVLSTDEPVEGVTLSVDTGGGLRWFRVNASPLGDGDVVYAFEETTERKRRQRRYDAIFNQTFQFTGLLEPDGTVVEANETALEFGGLDRDDVVGRKVWNTGWFRDGEGIEQVREAVERAREGEFVRREFDVQGADRVATIDFSVKPVADERGEVQLLVSEGRDITEWKARERRLQRQNERLDEFASVVSHDLRNPLAVARGNLDLARDTGDPEHFDRAEDALDRMDALVEDLLTLARKGQVVDETETVDVAGLARSAWRTVHTDDATLETEPVTVEADPERLRELLENLLRNAVEHGGHAVTVRVGPLPGEGLYVEDDGPGIPESEREAVFESGYTTTDRGTGFGLAIVESIAEAHDWTVSVTESEADGGERPEGRSGGARFELTPAES